jgi:dienelactone hydrolase
MSSSLELLGAVLGLAVLTQAPLMAESSKPEDKGKPAPKVALAPEFTVPPLKSAWERKRRQVREQLWQLLGKLPPRPKHLTVEVLSRQDRGNYTVEKLQFDNGAGATVPAYLLLPKSAPGKVPAVLYCHWHGGQYDVGKEELFRTNAVPVPPGPALAERGYAVLAIDAYCFGERNGAGPGGPDEKGAAGEMTAAKLNLWFGRTLWGMMLRDDLIALDYLCSRPEVDADRVGVTGISMGATRSWWLMGLEDRLKAGVAVCCLTRYQDLVQTRGLKYHGIYYFVPGMLNHFDTEAVVALSAPRALLFQSGELDAGSPVEGIRYIETRVLPAWKLLKREDDFESLLYPGVGHVYLPQMWDHTLQWLDKHLRPREPLLGRAP